jgi:phage host-nuclease inhibitor protein Gam
MREKFASPAHEEADRLLQEISECKAVLSRTQAKMNRELAEFNERWAQAMAPLTEHLGALEQQLKGLEKEQQAVLFPVEGQGSFSLDLPQGTLLYDKTDYVVKPRKVDVLANLEKYGFEQVIRRSAAVDWDALNDKEEWPDEVLSFLGTERKVKETFGYDLKEAGDGSDGDISPELS